MGTVIGKIYDTGVPGRTGQLYEGMTEHYIGNRQHHCKAEEITFDGVSMRWCDCSIDQSARVEVESREEFVELHYNITGQSSSDFGEGNFDFQPLRHSLFYSNGYAGSHQITGDKNSSHAFLEVKLSRNIFERLNLGMDSPGNIIMDYMTDRRTGWVGKTAPISPEMVFLISNIRKCPYSGMMKRLYLESKLMELYLLQINTLTADERQFATNLKRGDIDKIYEAREFIDKHYGEPCSIIYLASHIGLNQQKLKTGFREILGITVFGYLSEVRMQQAKRMLLEEKKYVGEVAIEVGYKNPHHFTAAFKKRFGFLPSGLRE
ncbi:AraC family transcriptional regulator [Chitinophaga niabensis]|uniref:AraC family transcriptional regulator n=1 Tax=Chitinophaga niabensis TaxID=536979 RepID=UPI0031BA0939